ncbi:MAG: F0F1 ATP synthase subunit delta [Verrucomicrobiota bacterium]|jgi:F-type H+-transporting ATPase subunit delta
MKISKLAQREARQVFRSCRVNGLLDDSRVRQATALLLAKRPHRYVEILSRLHRLVKLELERRAARVESATPLPADLQADVADRIRKIYGPGADITFSRNPALIGGLRVQVGSNLYDGSVRSRLEQLEQSF